MDSLLIQTQFSELIKLYKKAAEGENFQELELFGSAVSFLENLKFALQDAEITREAGMAMIELLSQHSSAYDRFLSEEQKKGSYKAPGSPKEIEQRKELKAKLNVLAQELGEFFRRTEDQPSSTSASPVTQVKKKRRRLGRQNWLRS